MNKDRFYQIIIAALLLLNAVLLFMHFNSPEIRKGAGPQHIIIEKLHFDKAQVALFETIIADHRELISANEAEINKVKNSLYQQLTKPTDSLKVDSLTNSIAELQKNAEIINFEHFQDIKKICKLEQLPLFEKLVGELSQLFGKKKPPQKK